MRTCLYRPGGIRQQFKAAQPMVESMMLSLKQEAALQGPLSSEVLDQGGHGLPGGAGAAVGFYPSQHSVLMSWLIHPQGTRSAPGLAQGLRASCSPPLRRSNRYAPSLGSSQAPAEHHRLSE